MDAAICFHVMCMRGPDTQALGQSGVKFEVFNIAWDDLLDARSGPSAKFPIIATFLLG